MVESRALADFEMPQDGTGRETHDQIRQALAYAQVQAQAALEQIAAGQTSIAAVYLARLTAILEGAGDDLGRFAAEALPARPHGQSFFPALEEYLYQFGRVNKLRVTLSLSGQDGQALLRPMDEVNLLRLIQEALRYAVTNAGALSAQVICTVMPAGLQVMIAHDGSGFDPGSLVPGNPRADSLQHMRDTVAASGGELHVYASRGKGTHLIAHFPFLRPEPITGLSALRFLLVDDHPLILAALRGQLVEHGIEVAGVAGDGQEAVEQARRLRPDVIMMDVQMPRLSGIEATRRIKAELPEVRVVMLDDSGDEHHLFEAAQSGACGYLLKTQPVGELMAQLARLRSGEIPLAPGLAPRLLASIARQDPRPPDPALGLSNRQLQILQMIAGGLTYKEIGQAMHISGHTVKYHVEQILERLHAETRSEALAMARRAGLIER